MKALDSLLEFLHAYLKQCDYWRIIQPVLFCAASFAAAEIATYEYVTWQYGVAPPVGMFIRSYYSQRVALVVMVVAVATLALQLGPSFPAVGRWRHVQNYVSRMRWTLLYRAVVVLTAAAISLVGLLRLSPRAVKNVVVWIVDEPSTMDRDALAYLIYELNRQQRSWYFELDFEPLNTDALTSTEQMECESSDRPMLCYAERWANGRQMIGVTERPLGRAHFAEHRSHVSVISTADHQYYAPLTDYEFVLFNIIVQGLVLHLEHDGSLHPQAFANTSASSATDASEYATAVPGATSHGGVFQYQPRKEAVKSMILAASLSPEEEEALFNSFGPEYLRTTRELLALRWLYSPQIVDNLRRYYGVELSRSDVLK